MPAYHSTYNDEPTQLVGNVGLLPFTSRVRGPAPIPEDPSRPDIIEEGLDLFRANCLFRNFEIQGAADRTLIYLILFTHDCLTRVAPSPGRPSPGYAEATKVLQTLAVDHFAVPGEAGFPLNSLYKGPSNKSETDALRSYLLQARQELAARLCDRIYPIEPETQPDGSPTPPERQGQRVAKPSKWWMSFQKRKFMGRSLS